MSKLKRQNGKDGRVNEEIKKNKDRVVGVTKQKQLHVPYLAEGREVY
jgi:hypothetical protein